MTQPANDSTQYQFRRRILIPVITILLLLTLTGSLGMAWLERNHFKTQFDNERKTLKSFYEIAIEQDAYLFRGILEMITANPRIQEAWQRKDRKQLFTAAQHIYNSLEKNYRVSRFNFYNPNRTVFLRMHQLHTHDDYLNQGTLIRAVRTGRPAHGLELGMFGKFVLHVVYPCYINHELVGFIELSEDVNHILNMLSRLSNVEIIELIDKQLIRNDEWFNYNGQNHLPDNWNLYPNVVLTQQTTSELSPQLQRYIRNLERHNIGKDLGFPLNIDYHDQSYRVYKLPLKNSSNGIVGELLMVFDTTDYFRNLKFMINILAGTAVVTTLLAILFFHRYLGRIEADVSSRNHQLQQLINEHEHTAKALSLSNKELTSYSYSIAHDLRTPLRSIISFGQILRETATPKISVEENNHLDRIIRAGKYMANVIDDILNLASITRSDLCIETINLTNIARQAAYNLIHQQQHRQVELHIEDNVIAKGDPILIEVVLQNLLHNSFKYTESRSVADIHFGNKMIDGERVYYVSDNGSGFDVQYASMLFKPFHRLNPRNENNGTGIGLATVARIIERHGGKIWAESIEHQGSTFYFTLPQ